MKTDKLRGIIAERGLSQAKVAVEIGMCPDTFYRKMKTGIFGTDEIEKMIEILSIDDPASIFLDKK